MAEHNEIKHYRKPLQLWIIPFNQVDRTLKLDLPKKLKRMLNHAEQHRCAITPEDRNYWSNQIKKIEALLK